jgi:hypothetical protein
MQAILVYLLSNRFPIVVNWSQVLPCGFQVSDYATIRPPLAEIEIPQYYVSLQMGHARAYTETGGAHVALAVGCGLLHILAQMWKRLANLATRMSTTIGVPLVSSEFPIG